MKTSVYLLSDPMAVFSWLELAAVYRTSDLNGGDRWLKGGLAPDSNEAAIKRRPLRDAVEKKALESQARIRNP